GEPESETRPVRVRVRDGHRAAVLAHDPLDDRESEPAPRGLRGETRLEQVRALLARKPGAVVGDHDFDGIAVAARRDLDAPARGGGLETVLHEVQEHAPELIGIRVERDRAGGSRHRETASIDVAAMDRLEVVQHALDLAALEAWGGEPC